MSFPAPRRFAGVLFLAMLTSLAAQPAPTAVPPVIGSHVYRWESLVAHATPVGQRRDVADNPTQTLERFESHISTLNPGLPSHPPHTHAQEELIIIKEGTLDVHINGREHRVGPGSLFFFASNDAHAVRNAGESPATYLVFNFATGATRTAPAEAAARSAPPEKLRSAVYDWEKLTVVPTPKGERREIFNSPTVTCRNFSVHVTTVNAGEASHAAHRHPDDEFIIVKSGRLEATINGRAETAGPGSIFFFSSNDEHGLRNVGDTSATYYVLRVITEKTPSAPR